MAPPRTLGTVELDLTLKVPALTFLQPACLCRGLLKGLPGPVVKKWKNWGWARKTGIPIFLLLTVRNEGIISHMSIKKSERIHTYRRKTFL